jgi:hypothetical protein
VTWFRVDDQLHDHWKTDNVPLQAMGLWVLAGSWCGEKRNGGFVPKRVIRRWASDPYEAEASADALVAVGLWYEENDGTEDGWRFHDWQEYNPTATPEELSAARAAAGRKGGLASGQARREASTKQVASSNEANASEATKQTKPPVPVPVPVPVPENTRATRSEPDPDFDRFWATYPKRVGKGQAVKAWRSALKKQTPDDLIGAAKRYADSVRGTEARYIANPSTWLNGERWADEPVTRKRSTAYDDPSLAWMRPPDWEPPEGEHE